MIADHLFCVLQDPFTDFACVDTLGLLAHLGRVVLLLLVHLGATLHRHNLLMFPFGLNVRLVLLSFDSVQLSLLFCYLPFEIGPFLGLLFLDFGPVLCLFLNLLHHGDLLCLHASYLLLHLLRLELLLIEGLG